MDLGRFCDAGVLRDKYSLILRLNREYKACYAAAYGYIRAACEIGSAGAAAGDGDIAAVLAQDFADSVLPRVSQNAGRVYKRFLRAFTHKGFMDYTHLNVSGSKLLLSVEKGADFSRFADELCRLASQAGYDVILGKDALTPRRNLHLILPQIGVVFTDEGAEGRLDRLDRATYRAALAAARKRLASAKALHDELEAVYIPTIDFAGLTALSQQHIRELKDEYTHRRITL